LSPCGGKDAAADPDGAADVADGVTLAGVVGVVLGAVA